MAWRTVYHTQHGATCRCVNDLPAGSFRCERFVKSSLASSIVGFIKGGSFELLESARASSVVSIDLVCHHALRQLWEIIQSLTWSETATDGGHLTSPFASVKTSVILSPFADFEVTSEATQPSVASGCHAFVPTS